VQALEPAGAGVGKFIIGLLALLCAALLVWVALVPLRPVSEDVRRRGQREIMFRTGE